MTDVSPATLPCDGTCTCPTPPAPPAGDHRAFRVLGLDCGEEVAALKRTLVPLVGSETRLSFDLMAGRVYVAAAPEAVSDRRIVEAIAAAGLRGTAVGADDAHRSNWWDRNGRLATTLLSAAAIATGLVIDTALRSSALVALGIAGQAIAPPIAARVAYLLGAAAGLWFVAPRAWSSLRSLRPDMNLLMTLAISGAVGIGETLEAATVSFLFTLSLLLESWSVGRARHAVRTLLDLTPPRARLVDEAGGERLVAPHDVAVGQSIAVHPGERIALDGVVVAGEAHVDAAPVTGESVPVAAVPGTGVFAGSIALDGALTVRVGKSAEDTVLAKIVRRVAEAGRRRARAERWVDGFARVYTPTVFAAAALTALLPPLAGAGGWSEWLYRALVLLVIGCPCALVISTPVSVVAGLAGAARRGVLIKGGDILELPAAVVTVAVDKTGTLTTGALQVTDVAPLGVRATSELVGLAAALAQRSTHPVAAAIVAYAERSGVSPASADDVRALPGRGTRGVVDRRAAWLGSHRMLLELGLAAPDIEATMTSLSRGGRTVVAVGTDDEVWGLIALADRPRPDAASAVAALHDLGVGRVVMLSGDTRSSAEAIAEEVGIDEVHADLLPDDKLAVLGTLRGAGRERRRRDGRLAYVGDGINDAPALAAADLGIAMGVKGSDVAIETADVALMSDELGRLPWLVAHSRRVLATIRVNVAFALTVKAVFAVATFAGAASLWAAIAADMGASLAVVFNGLRLLRTPD